MNNIGPPRFGFAQTDLGGTVLTCDEVYAAFLGVPREQAVGRKVSEFTDGGESGGPEMMINILVRTGEPLSIRRTFIRGDGSRLQCAISLCLIRDDSGQPHSVVGIVQATPNV